MGPPSDNDMKTKIKKAKVCVSVAAKSIDEVLTVARRIEDDADVIEIRLDGIDTIDFSPLITTLKKPLLLTNRPTWEGGKFSGDEEVRVASLVEAVRLNCAYVDLEFLAPARSQGKIMRAKDNSSTKLILSWHNFKETPSRLELLAIMDEMVYRGCDIGKIVTMANDYHDVLRVLQLQEAAEKIDFPLIAFCMGQAGVISRLATLVLGGYMTYCMADRGEATAPGQMSLATMRQIYKSMDSDEH